MAGILPPEKKSIKRKQWTLHDGPKSSLKRLRNQLANDGCPESQVVLAKQLLEEDPHLDGDQKENERLGVYWLIKASEQGNNEATELLNKCLLTGRGITEHNFLDVKSCIDMKQDEKIARKAAREMFASLSNGEDYITSEQLQKRMIEIRDEPSTSRPKEEIKNGLSNGELMKNAEVSDESEPEDIDWSQRSVDNNEKLTEDNLVSAAVNYTNGYLPLVNRMLCLTDPNLHALDHIPYIQRSIRHPWLAIQILYYKIIKFFGQSYFSILTRTDFQLLLLLIYSIFSVENIFLFLPMLLYYLSFIVMVLTTFQVLQSNRDYQDFRVWSCLFLTYSGGSLNPEQAEYQFIKNNLKPYGQFFIALLVNLIVYPLIAQEWLPQGEITVLSFCFMFTTLFTFMIKERKMDWTVLFSFAVNVLAKYPYEIDSVVTQGWRFLDLKKPTIPSYVIGNAVEFCLNFRLVFYTFIPLICVSLASRQKWKGTYKYFIPHCVTLSWLQLVIINSQGATMFSLLRGTLALVGLIMFLPLLGVTTVLIPSLAFAKWFTTNITLCIFVFFVFTFLGLLISFLLSRTRFSKFITSIQILTAFFGSYLLLTSFINPKHDLQPEKTPEISWEVYHNFCHQPAWDISSVAKTEIFCQNLEHLPVSWNGYINDIKLKSIKNNYRFVIDHLPGFLSDILICYFGETAQMTCLNDDNLRDCHTLNTALKKCNLNKLNRYTYEIVVRMQSGIWGKSAEINLIAENTFSNFTLHLKPNDKVYFKGVLVNNPDVVDGYLGGLKPYVRIDELGCLACHDTSLSFVKYEQTTSIFKSLLQILMNGLKFIFNLLFNPVFTYK